MDSRGRCCGWGVWNQGGLCLVGNKKKNIARAAAALLACTFILYGLARGEVAVVFGKAVNICFECIGLG